MIMRDCTYVSGCQYRCRSLCVHLLLFDHLSPTRPLHSLHPLYLQLFLSLPSLSMTTSYPSFNLFFFLLQCLSLHNLLILMCLCTIFTILLSPLLSSPYLFFPFFSYLILSCFISALFLIFFSPSLPNIIFRAFLTGFREMIPVDWMRMFSAKELQLLISGDQR